MLPGVHLNHRGGHWVADTMYGFVLCLFFFVSNRNVGNNGFPSV